MENEMKKVNFDTCPGAPILGKFEDGGRVAGGFKGRVE